MLRRSSALVTRSSAGGGYLRLRPHSRFSSLEDLGLLSSSSAAASSMVVPSSATTTTAAATTFAQRREYRSSDPSLVKWWWSGDEEKKAGEGGQAAEAAPPKDKAKVEQAKGEEEEEEEEEELVTEEEEKFLQQISADVDSTTQNRWAPVLTLPIESLVELGSVGDVQLNPNVFLAPIRTDILHRVVIWQLACKRKGLKKTKSRSEVSGGGKKPWQQKGLGRARAGSIRSPLWRGGGHIHAISPKDWSYDLPNKVQRMGLRAALSLKYAQGKVRVVESTKVATGKTKDLATVLYDINRNEEATGGEGKGWYSCYFIREEGEATSPWFLRASHNLKSTSGKIRTSDGTNAKIERRFTVQQPSQCNVYDILRHDYIVLTMDALLWLEEQLVRQDFGTPLTSSIDTSATAYYHCPTLEERGVAQRVEELRKQRLAEQQEVLREKMEREERLLERKREWRRMRKQKKLQLVERWTSAEVPEECLSNLPVVKLPPELEEMRRQELARRQMQQHQQQQQEEEQVEGEKERVAV
ncbi:50S ribosomal protein L4 [Balamuthia mandrillaris]